MRVSVFDLSIVAVAGASVSFECECGCEKTASVSDYECGWERASTIASDGIPLHYTTSRPARHITPYINYVRHHQLISITNH